MLPRWLGRDSQQPETTVATPAADEVGFSIRGLILTIMVFVAFGVFEDVLCEVLEARLGLPSLVGAVTAVHTQAHVESEHFRPRVAPGLAAIRPTASCSKTQPSVNP